MNLDLGCEGLQSQDEKSRIYIVTRGAIVRRVVVMGVKEKKGDFHGRLCWV